MKTHADRVPGDLGRRVAFRRRELGLSRQQVATKTGMAPEYLAHLERHPAKLTAETLLTLAVALDTTVDVLLGAAEEQPPGAGTGAADSPRFERLEAGECVRLLSQGGVGRVVFTSDDGPGAVPVNFAVYEGAVVFRTAEGSVLARQVGRVVGFEADRLDDALSQGWSVLVTGKARRIANPAVVARVRARVEPWAGGERHVYVVVDPARISGRRISS